jgi:hypothetical protein
LRYVYMLLKKQNRKFDFEVAQYLDYATVIENKRTIVIKLIISNS